MKIVTSGTGHTDIDALSSAIAYGEFHNCPAVLPAPLNATVPESMREWRLNYLNECPADADDFVIVDVSNPKFFPDFVDPTKISMVYDHHPGFEKHWGDRGQIEHIGACATQIFETMPVGHKISTTTANLLYTTIFAHTLNFRSSVTQKRDILAAKALRPHTKLPKDWMAQYYSEIEKDMLDNIHDAILKDAKDLETNPVAQLELWDAKKLLQTHDIYDIANKMFNPEWMLSMPSISEDKTYFLTGSDRIKQILTKNIAVKFNGNLGVAQKLLLRKEYKKFL